MSERLEEEVMTGLWFIQEADGLQAESVLQPAASGLNAVVPSAGGQFGKQSVCWVILCMDDVLHDCEFVANKEFNKPHQTDMHPAVCGAFLDIGLGFGGRPNFLCLGRK